MLPGAISLKIFALCAVLIISVSAEQAAQMAPAREKAEPVTVPASYGGLLKENALDINEFPPPPAFPVVVYMSVSGSYVSSRVNGQNDHEKAFKLAGKLSKGADIPYYFGYMVVDRDYNIKFVYKNPLLRSAQVERYLKVVNAKPDRRFLFITPGSTFVGGPSNKSLAGICHIADEFPDDINPDAITFGKPPDAKFKPRYKKGYFLPADNNYKEAYKRDDAEKIDSTIINPLPGMENFETVREEALKPLEPWVTEDEKARESRMEFSRAMHESFINKNK